MRGRRRRRVSPSCWKTRENKLRARDARIGRCGGVSDPGRFARGGTYRAVLKVHRGILVQGGHARAVYGRRTRRIHDLQRPEPVVHLGMDLHRGYAFAGTRCARNGSTGSSERGTVRPRKRAKPRTRPPLSQPRAGSDDRCGLALTMKPGASANAARFRPPILQLITASD